MKRKYILFLAGFLLLLGGVWWYCSGDSYSEQQRCLWNERRAFFPRDILFDSVTMNYSYGLELAEGLEQREGQKALEAIQRHERVIVQKLLENRDREARMWDVKVPDRPDPAKLPLEGLARSELIDRAEGGDGDACLYLALQQFEPFDARFGIAGLSWSALHEVERWLKKAVELKRPGAEFLLRYAGGMKEHLIKTRGVVDRGQGKELRLGDNLSGLTVAGYPDFLHALEVGDALPLLVAEAFFPEKETLPEKEVLYKALLKRAKEGDVVARRQLAQVYFHRKFWHSGNDAADVWTQMRQNEAIWKSRFSWLSGTQKDTFTRRMAKYGWMSVRDTRMWQDNNEACGFARQAARQGDLTGMYLFLRYGVSGLGRISRKDWDEMFFFSRVLMEAGYAMYLDEFGRLVFYEDGQGKVHFNENSLHHAILGSFYSGEYFRTAREGIYKGITLRQGRLWQWGWNDNLQSMKELERMGYWDEMWSNYEFMLTRSDQEAREYYLAFMNRKALEGDLLAMYYLSHIYENGMCVPVDLGRACFLLRQILEKSGDYPFVRSNYADPFQQANMDLADAAGLRLLDMTLKYPDFPERDERKAYEWVREVEKGKKFLLNSQNGLFCYLLGQVYERGLGTTADSEKALEYYGTSANIRPDLIHKGCQEAWNRLSAENEQKK